MKVRVSLGILLGTVSLFGQGSVNFSNSGGTDAQKVYVDSLTGALVPAGTEYTVALYYANDGVTDEDLFVQVGSTGNFVGTPGTPSGVFDAGARFMPIVPAGGFAMFQVRAWSTSGGSTWDEAFAQASQGDPSIKLGKSNVFRVDTADPTLGESPASILTGTFQGFAVVPEPSSFALGVLGGAIMCLAWRRTRLI